jgi:hypothetical protein
MGGIFEKNGVYVQALEKAQWAKTEIGSKDREEPLEKGGGPSKLGEHQDDDLEYDQETVDDGPEDTRWLVWNSAATVGAMISASCWQTERKRTRCNHSPGSYRL